MPSSDVLHSKYMIMPKLEKTNSVRCCKCSFPATNKTSFVVGRRQENTFFGTYSKILRMHTLNGHTALRKWSISDNHPMQKMVFCYQNCSDHWEKKKF